MMPPEMRPVLPLPFRVTRALPILTAAALAPLAVMVAASPTLAQPEGPSLPQKPTMSGLYAPIATQSALTGARIRAVAEVGNEPTVSGGAPEQFKGVTGPVALANPQITGRLQLVELGLEQGLIPQVGVRLSGEISQTIRDPITNPDLEDAFGQRQLWRLAGGSAQKPLFVAQIKDAYMTVADPERNGGAMFGQFRVPFTYERFSTAFPPLAVAPEETPLTDVLGSLGAVNYQPSTLARRHDIGVMLFGRSGDTHYYAGTFNGSGPNRLDDNGDKDFFARTDWRPSKTEEIGFSALLGNNLGYPGGLGPRPLVPPVKVFRRQYGVHARFQFFRIETQTEWLETYQYATEPGQGFEAGPRRGWYVDMGGAISDVDRIYAQYGNFHDPRTPEGRPYQSHQVVIGTVHKFAPGLSWRTEVQYRWEHLGSGPEQTSADYTKYLTSVEWAL